MKIIQKGVELTKAKLRAPYFPDNCNISSLRKTKQNFNLSIITVYLITMTCNWPCNNLLYLKQKTILFKLIYFFGRGGAAEKDRCVKFSFIVHVSWMDFTVIHVCFIHSQKLSIVSISGKYYFVICAAGIVYTFYFKSRF